MPSKPPSHPVGLEQLERLLWSLTALFFTGAAITLVGELVGWWQDAGEVALTILTVGGSSRGLQPSGPVLPAPKPTGSRLDSVASREP